MYFLKNWSFSIRWKFIKKVAIFYGFLPKIFPDIFFEKLDVSPFQPTCPIFSFRSKITPYWFPIHSVFSQKWICFEITELAYKWDINRLFYVISAFLVKLTLSLLTSWGQISRLARIMGHVGRYSPINSFYYCYLLSNKSVLYSNSF